MYDQFAIIILGPYATMTVHPSQIQTTEEVLICFKRIGESKKPLHHFTTSPKLATAKSLVKLLNSNILPTNASVA